MRPTPLSKSPTTYIGLLLIISALLSYSGLLDLLKFSQHLTHAGAMLCGAILIGRKVYRILQAGDSNSDADADSDQGTFTPPSVKPIAIARPVDKLPRRYFNPKSVLALPITLLTISLLITQPSCSSLKPASGNVVAALSQIAVTTGVQIAVQRYPQLAAIGPVVAASIREAVAQDADDVQGIRDACADCLASVVTDPTLRRVVYALIDNILQSARDQHLTNAQTQSLLLTLADSLDGTAQSGSAK